MQTSPDQRPHPSGANARRLAAVRAAPHWVVPSPCATADVAMPDGAVIRLRRHGNPHGPRLALSHGNGLAINAYLPFWSLLLDRFDVVLFDARNHGENPRHGPQGHDWPSMARDHAVVFQGVRDHFGSKPVAGVFHSLMSVAAIAATLDHGPLWNPLVVIDPPLFPPARHALEEMERTHMIEMALLARRRFDFYPGTDSFAAQLAARALFARWVPGAHLLFAEATLRHDPVRGVWALRCPKELEARIFETNMNPTLWPRLARFPVRVFLLGADPALPYPQQSPAKLTAALAQEHGLPYRMMPDTTHMLQIERPEESVGIVSSFLADSGFAAA